MTRIKSLNAKLNVNILQLVCIPLRLRIAMQTTEFPNVPRINIIEYASRKIHFIYVDSELHSRSNVVVLFIVVSEIRWRKISLIYEPNDRISCLEPITTVQQDVPLQPTVFFFLSNSTSVLSESRGEN